MTYCLIPKVSGHRGKGKRQERRMSWQAYVDDQLVGTQMVNKACIIGLNGGMWAQSAGFTVRRARACNAGVDSLRARLTDRRVARRSITLAGRRVISEGESQCGWCSTLITPWPVASLLRFGPGAHVFLNLLTWKPPGVWGSRPGAVAGRRRECEGMKRAAGARDMCGCTLAGSGRRGSLGGARIRKE